MKPDFERCRRLATQLLLRQNKAALQTDVRSLTFDRPVLIDSLQNYARLTHTPCSLLTSSLHWLDGGTLVWGNTRVVLYDHTQKNDRRINWTLAHEIGHIYLEHTEDGPLQEIEAHFFAAQLLMPEVLVQYLAAHHPRSQQNTLTRRDLTTCFGVSNLAAQKRLDSLCPSAGSCSGEEQFLLQRCMPALNQYLLSCRRRSISVSMLD
ncbi:ImmA/IrrE family metallo-endopeptidase [Oscillospiraceae bacterium MB08-C2-2]|nr:ImmA/IrrE family metallo-endopeptidase [Oscillospiraceae bacterium MB08-C2-2]